MKNKQKNGKMLLISLTCLIFIISFITMFTKETEASIMTRADFWKSPSSILGESFPNAGGSIYIQLYDKHQAGCFAHLNPSSSSTAGNKVSTIYDIDFDSASGKICIDAVNVAGKSKKSYADTTSIGKSVGALAAETNMKGNIRGIHEALLEAIGNGAVLKEANASLESWYIGWNHANRASAEKKNAFSSYEKMSKDTETEPEVKSKTVKKGGKECVIMGPFKMKFGGVGIKKVTAGGAKWTPSSNDGIYWSTTASETASDWSGDFNKKTSSTYALDNKKFYLAVDESEVDSECTIEIEQEEFEYYRARIIVCNHAVSQNFGFYDIKDDKKTVSGKASWKVSVEKTGIKLTIEKKDATTKEPKPLKAGFKIRCGTDKWLSGKDGKYKYDRTVEDAEIYYTKADTGKLALDKLKSGKYWIYEVKAPEGYSLKKQPGYDEKNKWVLCTEEVIQLKKDFTVTIKNTPDGNGSTLTITKKSEDGKALDAGFKIYFQGNDKVKAGWLKGSDKKYTTSSTFSGGKEFSTSGGTITATGVPEGSYTIYEVRLPTGYKWENQTGYLASSKIGSEMVTSPTVFCGGMTVSKEKPNASITIKNIGKPRWRRRRRRWQR